MTQEKYKNDKTKWKKKWSFKKIKGLSKKKKKKK